MKRFIITKEWTDVGADYFYRIYGLNKDGGCSISTILFSEIGDENGKNRVMAWQERMKNQYGKDVEIVVDDSVGKWQ